MKFSYVFEALRCYRKIHGRFRIPHDFIVPHGSKDYPKYLWGMKLGQVACSLRETGWYRDISHLFKDLGVGITIKPSSKKLSPRERFNNAVEAIQCYQKVYGRKKIVKRFEIPYGSKDFPPHLWGMKLGRTVNGLRSGNYKAFHTQLETLGIFF